MLIGLPASGKTSWAEKHCRQNPEQRYTVLGTNLVMEKMKVHTYMSYGVVYIAYSDPKISLSNIPLAGSSGLYN